MDGDSERIWHDNHARLLGFIAARVSDTTEAEDLLQKVLLTAVSCDVMGGSSSE